MSKPWPRLPITKKNTSIVILFCFVKVHNRLQLQVNYSEASKLDSLSTFLRCIYPPSLDWKRQQLTLHHTLVYALDRFEGSSSGDFLDAMPRQITGPVPLFLTPASNEFSPVPTQPGADGLVQHGITPADTVACQTGGHRPGCAKYSHTVPPYGNNVCWDHTG